MAQQYIGITLPITNGNTGMFSQSTTLLQQVRSNFLNLVRTRKGERLMQPDFGCDIHRVVFENITEEIIQEVRLVLSDATELWMPFLEISNIDVKTTTSNPNKIDIKVSYRFRNNPNVTDTITVSV